MSTTDATTRPPIDAAGVVEDPRPFFRALAVEAAEAWVDSDLPPLGCPVPAQVHRHIDAGRAVIRNLLHELAQVAPTTSTRPPAATVEQQQVNEAGIARAREALAATRPLCPGGGAFVDQDTVDGSCVTTCPVCRNPRPAIHASGRWWSVTAHRARHLAGCLDEDGKVDACICGLDDRIARINAAIAEAGQAAQDLGVRS